jgi:hypothetical protein
MEQLPADQRSGQHKVLEMHTPEDIMKRQAPHLLLEVLAYLAVSSLSRSPAHLSLP